MPNPQRHVTLGRLRSDFQPHCVPPDNLYSMTTGVRRPRRPSASDEVLTANPSSPCITAHSPIMPKPRAIDGQQPRNGVNTPPFHIHEQLCAVHWRIVDTPDGCMPATALNVVNSSHRHRKSPGGVRHDHHGFRRSAAGFDGVLVDEGLPVATSPEESAVLWSNRMLAQRFRRTSKVSSPGLKTRPGLAGYGDFARVEAGRTLRLWTR